MKIHHALSRASQRPFVVAVGFFDGMHRGHREIARAALRMRKPGWRSGVLTFANHPSQFLRPGTQPPLIMTLDERIDAIARLGFEECFVLPFDAEMAQRTPRAFLDALHQLGVRGIAVGENFRFGHKRAGDVALMRAYGAEHGVSVSSVANVMHGDERISSTRIRALIAAGDLEAADTLLGDGYEMRGRVELGFGRGHDLGFPTANVSAPEKLLPREGVYAAVARYDGRDYAALVSIGTNPQFEGTRTTVEVWMRDFHETIYGCELRVRDFRFVRDQRVFDGVDALMAQMQNDLSSVAYPSYG